MLPLQILELALVLLLKPHKLVLQLPHPRIIPLLTAACLLHVGSRRGLFCMLHVQQMHQLAQPSILSLNLLLPLAVLLRCTWQPSKAFARLLLQHLSLHLGNDLRLLLHNCIAVKQL